MNSPLPAPAETGDDTRGRRVLHVCTDYGVTSETFVPDAIEAAEGTGWQGWVAALRVHDRRRFPCPPDDRLIVAPALSLRRRGWDKLLRRSPTERFASAVADGIAAARPAIIHAHFGWAGLYALPIAQRTGLPLVCTFHASDVTIFPQRMAHGEDASPTYAPLFARLDHAFVVSRYIADALRDIGWRGETEIIPAGVRLDRFPPREAAPPLDPPRLVYVGRLVPRKGLDVLLHAVAHMRSRGSDVVLDVIGEGPEFGAYRKLASTLDVATVTRFLGAQGSSEIRTALAAAHALVMPSRTMPSGEVEGSPVVLKEALAVGVPVVATTSGGIPEVVPPRYRRELVPEDDPIAIAERVEKLLAAPTSFAERARVGRDWVETQFDWQVLGRRTAEIYSRLASARSSA
jgi:glycosyltransferase involved in cell wall biosynthesis